MLSFQDDSQSIAASREWTPELAEALAREAGIVLGERHWKVLSCCREDAARAGRPPGLRRIARLSGVDLEELHRLFAQKPDKLVTRIAGLPDPRGGAGQENEP